MHKKLYLIGVLVLSMGIFSSEYLFGCGVCGTSWGSDNITETTFNIEGMTCEKCVSQVKSALNIEGVKEVKVSLKNKVVTVKYDKDKVTIEKLTKAIAGKGFKAQLLTKKK